MICRDDTVSFMCHTVKNSVAACINDADALNLLPQMFAYVLLLCRAFLLIWHSFHVQQTRNENQTRKLFAIVDTIYYQFIVDVPMVIDNEASAWINDADT